MNQNGEVICIHIGQAGIQMGQSAWELLAAEHNIDCDGRYKESWDTTINESSFTTFFQETPCGQYVPRSLFIDLEPSVIDEIRVGSFGRIFHPDLMVAGMEDSGSNYARARYTRGQHIMPILVDKIRFVAESCDALQGFMIFSSYGGGTGSGLGSLFLNRLEHEFHRRPRVHVGIFPGPELNPVIVDPYNAVLFASDVIEQADFSILIDNTALYNILKKGLLIDRPNYANLNRISAQIISHLTSTLRFENALNNSLHEMQVNLIPYPHIKFPVTGFAPITCRDRSRHEVMTTEMLTRSVFHKNSLMVSCDINRGLFMANSLIYRGPFDIISVNQAVFGMKRDSRWVNWSPTGFKIGLSNQKPLFLNHSLLAPCDRSLFMISNTTAIKQVMKILSRRFRIMYNKQAFIHHYKNEGLELDEFQLAFEEIKALESLYKEIQDVDYDGNFEEDISNVFNPKNRNLPKSFVENVSNQDQAAFNGPTNSQFLNFESQLDIQNFGQNDEVPENDNDSELPKSGVKFKINGEEIPATNESNNNFVTPEPKINVHGSSLTSQFVRRCLRIFSQVKHKVSRLTKR